MSFRALLDHRAFVWRTMIAQGGLRVEKRLPVLWAVVSVGVRRPRQPFADLGRGLGMQGSRTVYAEAGASIEPRDLLELFDGPDAPTTLEVDDYVTRPRGHHVELQCRIWNGVLPGEEGS